MKSILPLALIFMGISCSGGGTYSIAVKNSTGEAVDNAAVVYGDFRSVTGAMDPGVTKTHRFVEGPPPERATVEWESADGAQHSKEVVVRASVPANFSGDIYFEIGPAERIRVWADTAGDRERRAWMDSAK